VLTQKLQLNSEYWRRYQGSRKRISDVFLNHFLKKIAKKLSKPKKNLQKKLVRTRMVGEELEKAKRIKAALDLVKQGMSVQKAANMYSLPRRTLRYHLTHKESFDIEAYTGGRKSALSSQLEKRLGEWVDQMVERGFTVDMALICEKAKLLAQKINLNNFQASSTWFFRVGFFSFISCPPSSSPSPSSSSN